MKKINTRKLYKAQYEEQYTPSKRCGIEIVDGKLELICFSAKHKLSTGQIVNMIYSKLEHEIFWDEKPS